MNSKLILVALAAFGMSVSANAALATQGNEKTCPLKDAETSIKLNSKTNESQQSLAYSSELSRTLGKIMQVGEGNSRR
tara:strand:- start:14733 stop:14966 length:234 start_codon:yes stop_codon:yes gene_type:complete